MSIPERPIAADWLGLRREVDARARRAADPLLGLLWEQLRGQGAGEGPVTMVDVGAGTGANRAYLQPRLPFPARWVLLDHDATLLEHPDHDGPTAAGPAQATVRRVLAGVEELPGVLAALAGPRVVTCSALLDLLTAAQLDTLLDALVDSGAPGLLALTVTGEIALDPPDSDDALVWSAFDAHQARAALLGPAAAAYLADRARARGALVVGQPTPWDVVTGSGMHSAAPTHAGLDGPSTPGLLAEFLARFLTDRAEAAAEQLRASENEAGAGRAQAWLARRLAALPVGMRLTVGHVDLLILPPA